MTDTTAPDLLRMSEVCDLLETARRGSGRLSPTVRERVLDSLVEHDHRAAQSRARIDRALELFEVLS